MQTHCTDVKASAAIECDYYETVSSRNPPNRYLNGMCVSAPTERAEWMKQNQLIQGLEELRSQRRKLRGLMWSVALFSVFVNLLMLTAPIYMLQLYDRVLGSRSEATLIALTLLMAFLFLIMGVLDYTRARILARAGAQFQASLDHRVFAAVMRQADGKGSTAGLKDLEAVQKLLSSPVITAAFDIPWTPFFLFAISIFHPWLGILAVSGGACFNCHHRAESGVHQRAVNPSHSRLATRRADGRADARGIRDGARVGYVERRL